MDEKRETTGMVVLQAESEVASINMLYGGAGCGKRVMTSSSSPGISLMQEGLSYITETEVTLFGCECCARWTGFRNNSTSAKRLFPSS